MALFGDTGRTFLGDCKCGRAKVIAGSWGDPPVAVVHCSGCGTYEDFCKCEEAVLVLTASEALQLDRALSLPAHSVEALIETIRSQS
jgi:hypothetical protein